ncbi:MAG: glycosyltransferase family 2 protein [Mycobacteriales bacterium]|nr:glycosyltransferase family 2 protein [Mycobacteriales bacterium]
MPPRSKARPAWSQPTANVTAVLVAHDGDAWLPDTLAALAASTLRPVRVVAVDTGSTDSSLALLRAAEGDVVTEVLALGPDVGFGEAVAAALQDAPTTEWLWLLHDDVAVEPEALERLLAHAADSPSAALLGPKVRDWHDPRVLVEVGITCDPGGHRETGLERREYDQGQYDDVRDVLAVGTAGALVRRAVYDHVGGLDPALAVFRDDLDLGWKVNAAGSRVVVVPQARVRHVRAATTGRRALDAERGRPGGVDRRNALYVLLAHSTAPRMLYVLPRLVLWCLLRVVGFLLTRQVLAARDELAALGHVLGRPGRLLAARRARAATRTVPLRALRHLFASRTGRLRAAAAELGDWLSGGSAPGASVLDAMGDSDDVAELAPSGGGALRSLLTRPPVLLVLALAGLALLAERSVLALSGGALAGGRLLPAPAGASDLWSAYAASWHPTAVGSEAAAPPALALLALLATVLLGKAWLAVDLLLLASVPLAGLTAFLAARRVVRHQVLRLWAAATWALLPVATGAVAAGRLDAAALQVGLPLVALAAVRVVRDDPAPGGWRRAWGLGLAVAACAAFAPVLAVLAAVVLIGAGLIGLVTSPADEGAGARRRGLAALIASGVPLVVLLPWSFEVLRDPARLLHGPGRLLAGPVPEPLQLVLLDPDGPGTPATWVTAGLVLAALGGLVRRDRHGLALTAWAVAGVGLVSALLLASAEPDGTPVWPGTSLQVAAGGLLVAALVAADGLRTQLARRSFGWRQLTAAVVAVTAAATPLLAGGAWLVRGADDPLARGLRPVLPAFAQAEVRDEPGLRTLVLRPAADRTDYELVAGVRLDLGDADTPPRDGQLDALDGVVADLLSPSGSDAAEALATRAVRYVALLPGPGRDATALVLDAQAGLTRRTTGEVLLWQVLAPAARLQLLQPAAAQAARRGDRGPSRDLLRTDLPRQVEADREGARDVLGSGPEGRLLVLSEAADDDWTVTIDGRELDRVTAWGWAQGFEVPAAGGELRLVREQGGRRAVLTLQIAVVVVVAVLAAPGARRRRGLEIDDETDETDETDEPDETDRPVPTTRRTEGDVA